MSFAEEKLALSPDLRPDGFDFCEYVPEKPPGMHSSTYRRYLSKFLEYRRKHTERTMSDLRRLVGPAGWSEIIRIRDSD